MSPNALPPVLLSLLRQARERAWGLISAAIFALVVIAYFFPTERSFIIEARTHAMQISLARQSTNSWRLEDVLICRRLQRGETAQAPAGDPRCDDGLFQVLARRSVTIDWPGGAEVRLSRGGGSSDLEIFVSSLPDPAPRLEGVELTPGSRILLSSAGWIDSGAIVFTGEAAIGAVPVSGETGTLVEGRYHVRERLLFRGEAVTVAEGQLFAGDRVQVVDERTRGSLAISGFVSMPADGGDGMLGVAYSPLHHSRLRVDRLDTEPAFVGANWSNRAINDPWLLGLTVMLALAVAIAELNSKLGRRSREKP